MSTKYQPPAATVGKWLRANGWNLGGLTGQDWPALRAAVSIVELWSSADDEGRTQAAIAFNACVRAMQPELRRLAYHAIAHVGDWSHRQQFWNAAQLPTLENPGRCTYE